MTPDLANNNIRESNPAYNNIHKISYYHHKDNNYLSTTYYKTDTHINTYSRGDTNYQKATIEAFKLLSLCAYTHKHKQQEFDQELCKTLVIKYRLSCSGCALDCEFHQLEDMK